MSVKKLLEDYIRASKDYILHSVIFFSSVLTTHTVDLKQFQVLCSVNSEIFGRIIEGMKNYLPTNELTDPKCQAKNQENCFKCNKYTLDVLHDCLPENIHKCTNCCTVLASFPQ